MSSPPHLGSSCLFPARSGLPGSSADLSSHAASNHPGRSDECSHPLLPRRCQASPLSGGLATFHCISGPNRVRLRCGLRVRPSKASPVGLLPLALAGLHVERVIYKVNSFQFTRSARLVLALQRKAKHAYLCYPPVLGSFESAPETGVAAWSLAADARLETWKVFPPAARQHLMERMRDRRICTADLKSEDLTPRRFVAWPVRIESRRRRERAQATWTGP